MANNADTPIVAGVLGSACEDWDDGVAAYAAGDYATAYRSWFPDSEQGFVTLTGRTRKDPCQLITDGVVECVAEPGEHTPG